MGRVALYMRASERGEEREQQAHSLRTQIFSYLTPSLLAKKNRPLNHRLIRAASVI